MGLHPRSDGGVWRWRGVCRRRRSAGDPGGHELLPENVRIIALSAYSPELNPIEKLWDIIKDRICNRAWADRETPQEAINTVLREYWANPKLVRSLIGEGLVSREANTSSRSVLVV